MSDEISLTVEETNELRIKLGLKPLRLDQEATDEGIRSIDVLSKTRPHTNDKDTDEGKRLFQELSSGGGILDFLDVGESADSASPSPSKKQKTKEPESVSSSDDDSSNSSDSSDVE